MILYHYTCNHSAVGIMESGVLRPHKHPLLPVPLLWLTNLDTPWRDALGLTSNIIRCDRTAHRFVIDTDDAVWWPRYARRFNRDVRRALEFEPGVMPAHWWVSENELCLVTPQAGVPA